jgi:hypothetical protein
MKSVVRLSEVMLPASAVPWLQQAQTSTNRPDKPQLQASASHTQQRAASSSPIYLSKESAWRPPLCSSAQSSRLQIQRSGFDSQSYQIFCQVVGPERGPLSLVSTTEELVGRNSNGSGLENREYGARDPSHWQHGIPYPQKLALISPTSGGHSVGMFRSQTQATEFSFLF